MNRNVFFLALILLCACAPAAWAAEDIFTGDKRLACEALLCLSSSHRPSECSPSISHYYSIRKYKDGDFSASRTRSARKQFLALCPTDDAYVLNLGLAISNTLNQCDADYLNTRKIHSARQFDVLAGIWSPWKVLGRSNNDLGASSRVKITSAKFPACSARQLSYAANLKARKEKRPYFLEGKWHYPLPTTCYQIRSEVDPTPPSDCQGLFRSNYTYYQNLKFENGVWKHN